MITSFMIKQYDDVLDLTHYDFSNDGFVGTAFGDDQNKKNCMQHRSEILATETGRLEWFSVLNFIVFSLSLSLLSNNSWVQVSQISVASYHAYKWSEHGSTKDAFGSTQAATSIASALALS
ncbi:hypothetical protein Tco_1133242 [Tanacetum coccineum]